MDGDRIAGVEYVTAEEGKRLLERQARKYHGMSADEFVRRYRAGEFDSCSTDVIRVAMLIPLASED